MASIGTGASSRRAHHPGRPYVEHLAVVVAILRRRWPDATEAEVEAAWLHDALEDTSITPEGLAAEGVSAEAVALIQMLTRPSGLTYRARIADLAASDNVSAIRIKLADNEHNSDPARPLEGGNVVERRYLPARVVLESGLAMCLERER